MTEQFISVPTMLKARFRTLDSVNEAKRYSGGSFGGGAALLEAAGQVGRQFEPMVRLLAEMDRKLDSILTLLQSESLADEFPDKGLVLELSGSGLLLECRRELAPGAHLEIVLPLDGPARHTLSAVATVRSVEQRSRNAAYQLFFSVIDPEDRDAVIAFVFSEERRRIRRSKGDDARD